MENAHNSRDATLPQPQTKSPLYQNIGLKIRALREQKGKTQAEIATLLGKSSQAYAKYEIAENQLSLDAMHTLAEFYGVSLADLLPDSAVLVDFADEQSRSKGVAEDQSALTGTPRDDRLSDAARASDLMLGIRNAAIRKDLLQLITSIRDA